MDDDKYSVLIDRLAEIRKLLDISSNDREIDADQIRELKQEMQEVRIRLGANESQIDELRKQIDELRKAVRGIPAQTQERVEDAMEPTKTEIQGLQDIIGNKKVIAMDIDKVKRDLRKWWVFW